MVIRVFSVHHRILRKPNHGLITSSPLSNLEFADLASQQAHNALTQDRLALGSRQRFSEPLTAGLKPISSGKAGLSGERREVPEKRCQLNRSMQHWLAVYSPEFQSPDRKSTRLNSSHRCISYAVFCLKKK